jgi:hypothetical protein
MVWNDVRVMMLGGLGMGIYIPTYLLWMLCGRRSRFVYDGLMKSAPFPGRGLHRWDFLFCYQK